MAELKARIRLRYDTLENWVTVNPILKRGEMALVEQRAEDQSKKILFKVGTELNAHFNDLPWGSALANDVYDWAKAVTKPSYSYFEIQDQPIICRTTAEWNSEPGYISKDGFIYIYSDKETINIGGQIILIPGIKIGRAGYPLMDLGFVTDSLAERLSAHVTDGRIHITDADREYWDNKISCVDEDDVDWEDNTLILYR